MAQDFLMHRVSWCDCTNGGTVRSADMMPQSVSLFHGAGVQPLHQQCNMERINVMEGSTLLKKHLFETIGRKCFLK